MGSSDFEFAFEVAWIKIVFLEIESPLLFGVILKIIVPLGIRMVLEIEESEKVKPLELSSSTPVGFAFWEKESSPERTV